MPTRKRPSKAKARRKSADPALIKELLKRVKAVETRTARMEVTIQNTSASLSSTDGESLLGPGAMAALVAAVVRAIQQNATRAGRAKGGGAPA